MKLEGLPAGLVFLKNPAVFSIDQKGVQLGSLTALQIHGCLILTACIFINIFH